MVTDMGCHIQTTPLDSCTHKDTWPLFTSKYSIKSKTCLKWNWILVVWEHTAHLHVLIRNFVVCPGVSGSAAGGCSPPRIREEGKANVIAVVGDLAATSDSLTGRNAAQHHGCSLWFPRPHSHSAATRGPLQNLFLPRGHQATFPDLPSCTPEREKSKKRNFSFPDVANTTNLYFGAEIKSQMSGKWSHTF